MLVSMPRSASILWLLLTAGTSLAQTLSRYEVLCDASAAVALDGQHFVVASVEDNTLRIFERGRPQAREMLRLDAFLRSAKAEADLEAATRTFDRIYWVGSLSRDSKGRAAAQHDRRFATDIQRSATLLKLRPVGTEPVPLLGALLPPSLQAFRGLDLTR